MKCTPLTCCTCAAETVHERPSPLPAIWQFRANGDGARHATYSSRRAQRCWTMPLSEFIVPCDYAIWRQYCARISRWVGHLCYHKLQQFCSQGLPAYALQAAWGHLPPTSRVHKVPYHIQQERILRIKFSASSVKTFYAISRTLRATADWNAISRVGSKTLGYTQYAVSGTLLCNGRSNPADQRNSLHFHDGFFNVVNIFTIPRSTACGTTIFTIE